MHTVVDTIADREGGPGSLSILDEFANPGPVLSWREVHDLARRLASVLAGHGLGPGSRIGLAGRTSADIAIALQAIWLIGGSVTVLPPALRGSPGTRQKIAADAGLAAVLAPGGTEDLETVLHLDQLLEAAAGAVAAPVYRPATGDLAVLQYTSGSTRKPQGVPVTHGHLMSNLEGIRTVLRHDDWHPGQWLSWLPLYHDLGLIAFFILPMSCGCPLALQAPESFIRNPAGWLTGMSRHRALISGAPNFAYAMLTRLMSTGRLDGGLDLSTIRMLVTGGEPVDAAMMDRFALAAKGFGLNPNALLPCYGMAEATLAASMTPVGAGMRTDPIDPYLLEAAGEARLLPQAGRKLVSGGFPVPGVQIRITDRVSGEMLGPRRVGHIELRGPSVVGHYWGEPRPAQDSWLRSGDLGYLTPEGEMVICGRDKDVVFAAGRNIFPQDVEAAAQEAPGVRPGGAAAFGLADVNGDQLIVTVESRGTDPADVKRGVTARVLAEVGMSPREVVVVSYGQLPKTTSGKLRRAEARRRYLAGEFRVGGSIQ